MGAWSGHYIVCGGNSLAYRLVAELVEHYEVPVVAIVPDRERGHAPRIEQLPGVTAVVAFGTVTDEALRAVNIGAARGIALVEGDDQSNIHTALAAQGRNPDLRIVLRMFNQRLGEQIEKLLRNCTALSGSATAASAFANAALQRPNSVQVGGEFLCVTYEQQVPQDHLCVAADRIDPQDLSRIRLLPEVPGPAAGFIALASRYGPEGAVVPGAGAAARARAAAGRAAGSAGAGASGGGAGSGGNGPDHDGGGEPSAPDGGGGQVRPAGPTRTAVLRILPSEPPLVIPWFSRLRWRLVDALHFFTEARLRVVLATVFAAIMLSFGVIWHSNSLGWTVYQTLLDMAGAAQPDQPGAAGGTGGLGPRVAQVVITLCGVTFVPVATAILVEILASGRPGLPKRPSAGVGEHVVVLGLGNVGTRVVGLLHALGVPVVCIERDPAARGIAAARALDIPVLVGDAPLATQLHRAKIHRSRALVSLTDDDAVNLEAALEARAVRPDVRIVARFFDDDFAHHVYATLGNVASRSVSYLSAPAFAAALMGREVLGTLSVFRHVLLIAELTAEEGGSLVGMSRHDLEEPGGIRVLGLRPGDGPGGYQWGHRDGTRRLAVGDRIVVAATRSGLGRLNTTAPPEGATA